MIVVSLPLLFVRKYKKPGKWHGWSQGYSYTRFLKNTLVELRTMRANTVDSPPQPKHWGALALSVFKMGISPMLSRIL